MRTAHAWAAAALAAVGVFAFPDHAAASSHREAPAISNDPAADNTDLWAWHSGSGATAMLHVVASYIPLEEPSGGPNYFKFSDDVLYEIHVARGDGSLDDVVTYQLRFNTPPLAKVDPADQLAPLGGGKEFFAQLNNSLAQTYTLSQVIGTTVTVLAKDVPVPLPSIGPRTQEIILGQNGQPTKANYEQYATGAAFARVFAAGAGQGAVWAGQRDDGFYVDLGGVFDLANFHSLIGGVPRDNIAGFNCHSIALDIPFSAIPAGKGNVDAAFADRLGVWASTSRRKVKVLRNDGTAQWSGPWVQVSRLGLPLINELMIGAQDKDKYNRTHPKNDVVNFAGYLLSPVIVRDAEAVGVYATLGVDPSPLKNNRLDILQAINILDTQGKFPLAATGDVLRVDPAAGNPGFPNGRPLGGALTGAANKENDVTNIMASIVLLGLQAAVSNGFPIDDGVSSNDADYTNTLPYLPTPWRGWDEGHGKAAP
jgi:hypothetical protein